MFWTLADATARTFERLSEFCGVSITLWRGWLCAFDLQLDAFLDESEDVDARGGNLEDTLQVEQVSIVLVAVLYARNGFFDDGLPELPW